MATDSSAKRSVVWTLPPVPDGVDLDRVVSHQSAQRVDEMTAFAGESRSFQFLVEIPAARVQTACVDQVASRQRTTGWAEAFLQIGEERCKPSVEPDHEPLVAGSFHGVQDCGELLVGEGKRLLDEDGEAALQGLAHQTSHASDAA